MEDDVGDEHEDEMGMFSSLFKTTNQAKISGSEGLEITQTNAMANDGEKKKLDSLEYWQRKTQQFNATVEAMLLDHNASRKKLADRERKEILGYLCRNINNIGGGNVKHKSTAVIDSIAGKDVADLGKIY